MRSRNVRHFKYCYSWIYDQTQGNPLKSLSQWHEPTLLGFVVFKDRPSVVVLLDYVSSSSSINICFWSLKFNRGSLCRSDLKAHKWNNNCSGRFCFHSNVNADILGSLSALEVFLVDFWAFGNRWRDKVSWGHFSWRDREDSCLGLVWIFTATPLLWDRGEGSSKSSNRIMPPFMAVTLPAWKFFKMSSMQFKFKLRWCLINN